MWILIRHLASRAGFLTLPGESINTWPSGTIHSCKVAIYFQLSITWQIITQSIQLSCATCTNGNNTPAGVKLKHESTFCSSFRWSKKIKHTLAALLQRWRRDKVTMASRNIIRSERFHLFSRRGGGKQSGGADARGNPGWKDMMFSLPKKKKCFYKVMWVYKEKVTACWQSNMDYSLEACQSPKMCSPSLPPSLSLPSPPPKRQLLKIQWIKAFLLTGVQIRTLGIKSPKTKTITALPTFKHFHTFPNKQTNKQ